MKNQLKLVPHLVQLPRTTPSQTSTTTTTTTATARHPNLTSHLGSLSLSAIRTSEPQPQSNCPDWHVHPHSGHGQRFRSSLPLVAKQRRNPINGSPSGLHRPAPKATSTSRKRHGVLSPRETFVLLALWAEERISLAASLGRTTSSCCAVSASAGGVPACTLHDQVQKKSRDFSGRPPLPTSADLTITSPADQSD